MNRADIEKAKVLLDVRRDALSAKTESSYLDAPPTLAAIDVAVPRKGAMRLMVNRNIYEAMLEAARVEASRQLEALGVTEIGF